MGMKFDRHLHTLKHVITEVVGGNVKRHDLAQRQQPISPVVYRGLKLAPGAPG